MAAGRVTKKRRQHYVPQLLLRRFSSDGHRISLMLTRDGSMPQPGGLRDQCYKRYFYGRTPEIEDGFKELEDAFVVALRLADAELPGALPQKKLFDILRFVHFQRLRTLAAAKMVDALADAAMRKIASSAPELADIELDRYRLVLDNPQLLALEAAAHIVPLILDLSVKFVRNDTAQAFVLGDVPVASYNQWAEHHPVFGKRENQNGSGGGKGVALKGLQWFLPVSPTLCVAVYDPTTYMYGSDTSQFVRANARDVRLLNALQALHAKDCLYFWPGTMPDDERRRLMVVRGQHPVLATVETVDFNGTTIDEPNRVRAFFTTHSPDPRIGAKFHFVQVIDRKSYRGYDLGALPCRNPRLVADFRAGQADRYANTDRSAVG